MPVEIDENNYEINGVAWEALEQHNLTYPTTGTNGGAAAGITTGTLPAGLSFTPGGNYLGTITGTPEVVTESPYFESYARVSYNKTGEVVEVTPGRWNLVEDSPGSGVYQLEDGGGDAEEWEFWDNLTNPVYTWTASGSPVTAAALASELSTGLGETVTVQMTETEVIITWLAAPADVVEVYETTGNSYSLTPVGGTENEDFPLHFIIALGEYVLVGPAYSNDEITGVQGEALYPHKLVYPTLNGNSKPAGEINVLDIFPGLEFVALGPAAGVIQGTPEIESDDPYTAGRVRVLYQATGKVVALYPGGGYRIEADSYDEFGNPSGVYQLVDDGGSETWDFDGTGASLIYQWTASGSPITAAALESDLATGLGETVEVSINETQVVISWPEGTAVVDVETDVGGADPTNWTPETVTASQTWNIEYHITGVPEVTFLGGNVTGTVGVALSSYDVDDDSFSAEGETLTLSDLEVVGDLPDGLSFNFAGGVGSITGTPTTAETVVFELVATFSEYPTVTSTFEVAAIIGAAAPAGKFEEVLSFGISEGIHQIQEGVYRRSERGVHVGRARYLVHLDGVTRTFDNTFIRGQRHPRGTYPGHPFYRLHVAESEWTEADDDGLWWEVDVTFKGFLGEYSANTRGLRSNGSFSSVGGYTRRVRTHAGSREASNFSSPAGFGDHVIGDPVMTAVYQYVQTLKPDTGLVNQTVVPPDAPKPPNRAWEWFLGSYTLVYPNGWVLEGRDWDEILDESGALVLAFVTDSFAFREPVIPAFA